jgi:hypothetical protein
VDAALGPCSMQLADFLCSIVVRSVFACVGLRMQYGVVLSSRCQFLCLSTSCTRWTRGSCHGRPNQCAWLSASQVTLAPHGVCVCRLAFGTSAKGERGGLSCTEDKVVRVASTKSTCSASHRTRSRSALGKAQTHGATTWITLSSVRSTDAHRTRCGDTNQPGSAGPF